MGSLSGRRAEKKISTCAGSRTPIGRPPSLLQSHCTAEARTDLKKASNIFPRKQNFKNSNLRHFMLIIQILGQTGPHKYSFSGLELKERRFMQQTTSCKNHNHLPVLHCACIVLEHRRYGTTPSGSHTNVRVLTSCV
jgi:hypothetical protein